MTGYETLNPPLREVGVIRKEVTPRMGIVNPAVTRLWVTHLSDRPQHRLRPALYRPALLRTQIPSCTDRNPMFTTYIHK